MAGGAGHLREGLSTGFTGKWREEGVIEGMRVQMGMLLARLECSGEAQRAGI